MRFGGQRGRDRPRSRRSVVTIRSKGARVLILDLQVLRNTLVILLDEVLNSVVSPAVARCALIPAPGCPTRKVVLRGNSDVTVATIEID